MKKIIKLNESDILKMVLKILSEQNKGSYKPEWDKEDQILAMFNSMYGVEQLGVTKQYVANDVIGTSTVSLTKQSSNFDYLDGRGGFDRPHPLQTEVYNEFKNLSKEKFKSVCFEIIREKEKNPSKYVSKFKLGNEIGDMRDNLKQSRDYELLKRGYDPKKMTLISSKPLEEPSDDENVGVNKKDLTPAEEMVDFLNNIYLKLKDSLSKGDIDSVSKLVDDVEFLRDYMKDQLVDSNTISEIKNLFKQKIKLREKVSGSKKIVFEQLKTTHRISPLNIKKDLDELSYDDFTTRDDLDLLRVSLGKNKTVGVAFVKKDGTVRHMCIKKNLNSYVPSDREKTENQKNVQETHNLKRVIDVNSYIKTLRETGDKSIASKGAWRTLNLETILGFTVGGGFIDLRGENQIRERFGEDVYNSLTKTMMRHIQNQQEQNQEEMEQIMNDVNENRKIKKIKITETQLTNIIKRTIYEQKK